MWRWVVAGAVCCSSLVLGASVYSQGDKPERLPEPAHLFAKEAAHAVVEEERAWLKRADELEDLRNSETASAPPNRSLSVKAAALLARSHRVLAAYRSTDRDLRLFQSLLRKAAGHYREVAELYVTVAGPVKSGPVREDYDALIDAYRHQSAELEARAQAIGLSPAAADQAVRLEEGVCFLERLAEVTAVVPASEADEKRLADRLGRHVGQSDALAEELARTVRSLLAGSEDPEVRKRATTPPATESATAKREASFRAVESSRATPSQLPKHFPLAHIRPTGDWAALVAGPTELAVGDKLCCERRGEGLVGTLQVASYSRESGVFVVRALGRTLVAPGDSARR